MINSIFSLLLTLPRSFVFCFLPSEVSLCGLLQRGWSNGGLILFLVEPRLPKDILPPSPEFQPGFEPQLAPFAASRFAS